MTKPVALRTAALATLALLCACEDEPAEVDTSFESAMPAPVPVEEGAGPVPDNEPVGDPNDTPAKN